MKFLKAVTIPMMMLSVGLFSYEPGKLIAAATNSVEEKTYNIEDAVNFYKNNRFDEAKKSAQRILQNDPKNQEAQRILGMISFQEGEYKKAYSYLKGISSSDPAEMKARAITFVLNGNQEGSKLLEEITKSPEEKTEVYFTLAYGYLILEKPIQALEWFEKIDKNKLEQLPGRCFAAFEMDSWQESLEQFKALPSPYKDLDGFQGVAIESMTSLGKIAEAEQMLANLLKKYPEPDSKQFSPYFQTFKKKKLDFWNRNYVAAIFYKEVKKDPKKSLFYFSKIENPTPIGEIERAELLIGQGEVEEGRITLLNVLRNIQGTEDENKIKSSLLPLLGKTLYERGYYADALIYYIEFLQLNPHDIFFRSAFANTLISLKRYDLAFEQLRMITEKGQGSPSDMVALINCLVHTDQFEKANEMAGKWLASGNIPFVNQLQVARLMVITKNKSIIEAVIHLIEEKGKRTTQESLELLGLWIDLGNYESASSLIDVLRKELEKTPDGLMVMVDLDVRLSKMQEAQDYAEIASQMNPGNPKVLDFFERFEKSPDAIAREAKILKEKLEIEPDSLSLQMDYAKILTEIAVETFSSGEIKDITQSFDLQTSRITLEKVIKKTKEIPAAFFLLGKVYYLLDKDKEAAEAYKEALKLDLSYVDAYQHLALLYEDQKEFGEAISLVKKAVKFDPSDGDAWLQLASLYIGNGNHQDAINALQDAVRYKPNDPRPYIKLAIVYLQIKTPEKAVSNLGKVLTLAPKDLEGLKLMLIALYDPAYMSGVKNPAELKKIQIGYFDKLQAIDPKEAADLRKKLNVKAE